MLLAIMANSGSSLFVFPCGLMAWMYGAIFGLVAEMGRRQVLHGCSRRDEWLLILCAWIVHGELFLGSSGRTALQRPTL